MRILITGGAGFIGSALVRHLIADSTHEVLNLDKLTYAGTLDSLAAVANNPRYGFVHGDIGDAGLVATLLAEFKPQIIVHMAAESHVDRSIAEPGAFIQTNIVGTYTLLDQALRYWQALDEDAKAAFRFHHVSTDEVFGSLGETGHFTESSPYAPRSPYSASKAAADHLVRAWSHTYGLPVLLTAGCNSFGPYQFPEKLMPLAITRALAGEILPVYGDGRNVRDWLFVEDYARALRTVFEKGAPGQTYNIGANAERRNIDVITALCQCLNAIKPRADGQCYTRQIRFVPDRPGHDHRYAMDAGKIHDDLGWTPKTPFEEGIDKTVRWYLSNEDWWQSLTDCNSPAPCPTLSRSGS